MADESKIRQISPRRQRRFAGGQLTSFGDRISLARREDRSFTLLGNAIVQQFVKMITHRNHPFAVRPSGVRHEDGAVLPVNVWIRIRFALGRLPWAVCLSLCNTCSILHKLWRTHVRHRRLLR